MNQHEDIYPPRKWVLKQALELDEKNVREMLITLIPTMDEDGIIEAYAHQLTKHPLGDGVRWLPDPGNRTCGLCAHRQLGGYCIPHDHDVKTAWAACDLFMSDGIPF